MTGSPPGCTHQDVLDISCDSDSGDTVILKDDDACDQSEKGVSFIRFISIEGNATTDGDLVPSSTPKHGSNPKLTNLPTGLSFLNSSHLFSPNLSPGSFMFTECRLEMGMDDQKSRQMVENSASIPASTSSNSDSAPPLTRNFVEIAPKILPTPVLPSSLQQVVPTISIPETIPNSAPNFKHPKPVQLSQLRCKNREAARKCRAKKKNYIQQLENDFKELKVALNIPSS